MGYGLLLGDATWFIGDNYDFIHSTILENLGCISYGYRGIIKGFEYSKSGIHSPIPFGISA